MIERSLALAELQPLQSELLFFLVGVIYLLIDAMGFPEDHHRKLERLVRPSFLQFSRLY